MEKGKNKHKVPEHKIKEVKSLAGLIDSHNTILLASIKSLPAKNFQKIKKKLFGKGIVKVMKKRALVMAIKSSKKESVKELEKYLKEDMAFIISNNDAFELAAILSDSKFPVKAKAGQIAEEDIEIEAGVTEIPAGPAVSEFGNASVQVKVTNGKIEVIKSKVVVTKGKEISEGIVSLLGKLDITPFSVGFIPLVGYASESGKIYTTLIIDKEELLDEMKNSYAKSRAFAVSLDYISKDIIGMLLAKASVHERSLNSFVKEGNVSEESKSEEGK